MSKYYLIINAPIENYGPVTPCSLLVSIIVFILFCIGLNYILKDKNNE